MVEKIRVLSSSEVPSMHEDVDLFAIDRALNADLKTLIAKMNVQELGDWRLLILVVYRSTDGLGVFKRTRRYPSDKEFEISISISVPNDEQASYGLAKVKEGVFLPLNEKFYILESNFQKYANLYDYLLESAKQGIHLALTKGVVCGGHRITFQP